MFMPVSIRIDGKAIVLIGVGRVALHKAVLLSRFTQVARVIAPEFDPGFAAVPFERVCKSYDSSDLDGAFLVYICTGDRELNVAVKAECERCGILACVCDDPALCDFISPAIYRDGNVTVAVSSDAKDVRRSIRIRDRIKTLVEEGIIPLK
ncbi:MAG: bifunctional precorrin-2 dehydrogenase/sirohydrochlorin ferrochelatase [Tannerella sp.]|jgi:siroheme synthase-like protein|nr:bifunctional precorrin-2 dehydrogenase/sirohydrochlorin ferrochelatase [Tannerella sp.]